MKQLIQISNSLANGETLITSIPENLNQPEFDDFLYLIANASLNTSIKGMNLNFNPPVCCFFAKITDAIKRVEQKFQS